MFMIGFQVSWHSIQQITTESTKSLPLDLRLNYHNETNKMIEHGDRTVQILDKADKVWANVGTFVRYMLLPD